MIHPIAIRYATALFEIGLEVDGSSVSADLNEKLTEAEQKNIQSYLDELLIFKNLCSEDEEIKRFFVSSIVNCRDKEKVLRVAFKQSGLSEVIKNFIFVLIQNKRLNLFLDVIKYYEIICDKKNSIIRGELRAATVLDNEKIKSIQDAISKKINKKVILNFIEDKKNIAGIVATAGSYTFNDTVASHLTKLNTDLNRRSK